MTQDEIKYLEEQARKIRCLTVESIGNLGIGHIGGCLSVVDALAILYFKHMNIKVEDPKWEDRDRFVLSKGHAGPALYATLSMKGFFGEDLLDTLNRPGTNLPSHADMNRTPGVDMTTGSLGQGFSCALGIAIGAAIDKKDLKVYAMIGDGESQEGQIWEAAMVANHMKLNNLIAFTDYNKMQIGGTTDEVNTLEPLDKKWESFGWFTQVVDGHDMEALDKAIEAAKSQTDKPSMIIMDTIKGKGPSFCESKVGSHNMPVTKEMAAEAIKEINSK